jgi:hypothetical protein
VGVGWILFISVFAFLYSTSYTFFQNLIVTFDSLIVATLIGLALIYKMSGIGNIMEKFQGIKDNSTQKEDTIK